ncbi:hypothetical protein OVA07_02830 [Novosphingobium sp. SL115]|uniref:hypothetical protein n=1 Tax=Novosphingobium sp. SL115 TaxID=2995150 RepID=UPI0022763699|nr:hypothetical protein [Novosphingobium sp. SL115]MCY1669943.1 hypothetical protein [Novosphingobium sp. SL115]
MAINNDIVILGKRIAPEYGWPAAKAFKAYEMGDADRAALSRCAIDLLSLLPPAADAAQMSAALAVGLERCIAAPVFVVSGTLAVNGVPVFGPSDSDESPADASGHTWIMVGPYVVDIALFRLAFSAQAPALLTKHINLVFGPGKALYVDHWHKTRLMGLTYQPHSVLNEAEITRLMGDAFHLIKQARG